MMTGNSKNLDRRNPNEWRKGSEKRAMGDKDWIFVAEKKHILDHRCQVHTSHKSPWKLPCYFFSDDSDYTAFALA